MFPGMIFKPKTVFFCFFSFLRTKKPPTPTTTPSFDGAKTLEELNQAHISYLLKQPSFTIDDDNEPNLFKNLEIMEPVEFQNLTFQQHLDNLPWEDGLELTRNIERTLINGKHMTFCRLHNDTLALVSYTDEVIFNL